MRTEDTGKGWDCEQSLSVDCYVILGLIYNLIYHLIIYHLLNILAAWLADFCYQIC